jgi:hypothetical protein
MVVVVLVVTVVVVVLVVTVVVVEVRVVAVVTVVAVLVVVTTVHVLHMMGHMLAIKAFKFALVQKGKVESVQLPSVLSATPSLHAARGVVVVVAVVMVVVATAHCLHRRGQSPFIVACKIALVQNGSLLAAQNASSSVSLSHAGRVSRLERRRDS